MKNLEWKEKSLHNIFIVKKKFRYFREKISKNENFHIHTYMIHTTKYVFPDHQPIFTVFHGVCTFIISNRDFCISYSTCTLYKFSPKNLEDKLNISLVFIANMCKNVIERDFQKNKYLCECVTLYIFEHRKKANKQIVFRTQLRLLYVSTTITRKTYG